LSELMTHNEREFCDKVWQYKVLLLYSEYPAKVQTRKVDVTRCEWATEIAWQFYRKSSSSTEANLNCIDLAVNTDPTIMIVGRLAAKGED
jgi:hypothetical protein